MLSRSKLTLYYTPPICCTLVRGNAGCPIIGKGGTLILGVYGPTLEGVEKFLLMIF